jgi:hypothetical protein
MSCLFVLSEVTTWQGESPAGCLPYPESQAGCVALCCPALHCRCNRLIEEALGEGWAEFIHLSFPLWGPSPDCGKAAEDPGDGSLE